MFACLALIFSYVEALIPFNAGIPGVKLGLANLVIIIALYEMNFRYALAVNLIRIFISGLLFSGVFGTIYSLAGGLLSLIVMWLLKKTGLFQYGRRQYGRRRGSQYGTASCRCRSGFRSAYVPVFSDTYVERSCYGNSHRHYSLCDRQ